MEGWTRLVVVFNVPTSQPANTPAAPGASSKQKQKRIAAVISRAAGVCEAR